jgi:hypothetical protein
MARDAARKRELREEPLRAVLVRRDVRIDLAIGPFEIGIRDQSRTSMPRTGDVNHIEVVFFNQPIQVNVK